MSNSKLSEKELNELYKKGCLFKSTTEKRIYSNYNLFARSLYKNYDRTMKALEGYDFDGMDLLEMDENTSYVIHDMLIKHDFGVSRRNLQLIKYNPLILLASLEKNYVAMLSLIINSNNNGIVYEIPSFSRENKLLENNLISNNFVLVPDTVSLIENNSVFLIASLKNDYKRTMKTLSREYKSILNMRKEEIEEVMKIIFEENEGDFTCLPPLIKNLISKYIADYYIYDEKMRVNINKLVDEGRLPLTYFDGTSLGYDYDLIAKNCQSLQETQYIFDKVLGTFSDSYTEEEERLLLNLLSASYKECNNVEEAIKKMYESHKTRDNMSLLELLCLNLYVRKVLKQNNINCLVDIFALDSSFKKYGSTSRSKNDTSYMYLYINANHNELFDMIKTMNHELEHLIQDKNIREGNIDKDYDIDLYSKDSILKEILPDSYYWDNYSNISFEYDAEMKASIRNGKIFSLLKVDYEHNNDFKVMQDNAKKAVRYGISQVSLSGYRRISFRNNYNNLNSIFEKEMEKLRIEDTINYLNLLDKNPIIKYDYKWSVKSNFRRKTIKELVDDLDNCENKREKGIYFNLLKTRIDIGKEESDISDNLNVLKKLCEKGTYREDTIFIIKKVLEISYNYESKKYEGYFYRNGGNKR